MNIKRKVQLALFSLTILFALSGCDSTLSGHTVKLKQTTPTRPVIAVNYDYQGQKVDQFKTNNLKIKSDKKVLTAIDANYGENKIVHSSSAFMAYQGVTNYADKYYNQSSEKAMQNGVTTQIANKALPTAGDIYHEFAKEWPDNGTVVEVKTTSGSLIGLFVGQRASLTDFGSDDDANAVVNLDGNKIFLYSASYTLYPISAAKSMYHNNKTTNKAMQASIKTHAASVDNDSTKTKKDK